VKSPANTRPPAGPTNTIPAIAVKRGPRPSSLAVDKTAPVEDQLAAYKNVFARGMGQSQGQVPGEPLSEIDEPQI
jgi:hypothetical protein